MTDILNKATGLVLNRNWQAINVRTPAEAFCQMATNVATALDIESEDSLRPVTWEVWIVLPIRPQDNCVRTPRGAIRAPTVIVCADYAKVPRQRPTLSPRNIRERDGNRCQYTGRLLRPDELSIDHVLPRSRGGKTSWENCVLAHKRINASKGDRLPEEAGLRLLTRPRVPAALPSTLMIRNSHDVKDWELFLASRLVKPRNGAA